MQRKQIQSLNLILVALSLVVLICISQPEASILFVYSSIRQNVQGKGITKSHKKSHSTSETCRLI